MEALVDSRWKAVPQHHHRRVYDDLSAPAPLSRDLPLSSATVQPQRHLIVMPVQGDLVPFTVVEAISRQGQVVVAVAKVKENTEEALVDLEEAKKKRDNQSEDNYFRLNLTSHF